MRFPVSPYISALPRSATLNPGVFSSPPYNLVCSACLAIRLIDAGKIGENPVAIRIAERAKSFALAGTFDHHEGIGAIRRAGMKWAGSSVIERHSRHHSLTLHAFVRNLQCNTGILPAGMYIEASGFG